MSAVKVVSTAAVSISILAVALYFSLRIDGAGQQSTSTSELAFRPNDGRSTAKSVEPTGADGGANAQALVRDSGAPLAVSSRKPVATVNGVAITAAELEDELGKVLISPTVHGGMNNRKKDDLRKTALEELIVRELAYQKAKAAGLSINGNEFAAAIKKIKQRYKSEKSFREALKAEEITEKEFEQRIEKDLLLRKIHKIEIEDRAQVSDPEARAYYEANKAKFVIPESLRLKNIVVKCGSDREEEAKKKIDEAAEMLQLGKDFAEVAYKFSEDDYRVMGGDYGTVHRGQLASDVENKAFEATPGQVTGPFRSAYGWHLIKVENKQPERQMKYEEVKDKIKTSMFEKRRSEKQLEFINNLKAAAQITYPSK